MTDHKHTPLRRGQWDINTHRSWFEFPSDDPAIPQIWGHTDKTSYQAGETVSLHVSTTAASWQYRVYRDGATMEVVREQYNLTGTHQATRSAPYRNGTGWQAVECFEVPGEWRSGGYVVVFEIAADDGTRLEQEAFFIVRADKPNKAHIAFVAATTTWQAYNDWGGSNFYEGIEGDYSPTTSTLRPWARGQIRLPEGAPRIPINEPVPIGAAPRYPVLEYGYAQGFSKYHMAAGWASFDRLFTCWAEEQGYVLDYFAQDDLHLNPDVLSGYQCVVMVGHDEYHSREERTAIDRFIEQGGNLARFAGNVIWQTRRSPGELTCYKYRAATEDPVRHEPNRQHLLTTAWESQALAWPPAHTWGVNGFRGVYMKMGGAQPRASGGFTVYRPKHWALEGTDLYYGDLFGTEANIAGFEGDGVEYTFRHGLPYPTGEDGAPENLEIVAMALAGVAEEHHNNPYTTLYVGDADLAFASEAIYGEDTPENRDKLRYGCSIIANFTKGHGEVMCCATTEWVNGLRLANPFVETITQNVLNRFLVRRAPTQTPARW